MNQEKTKQIVALSLAEGMGPKTFKKLLSIFGDPESILNAPASRLAAVKGIQKKTVAGLLDKDLLKKADAEIEKARRQNVRILTQSDTAYPSELKEIYDPPILLYVRGVLPSESQKVAIVGARIASLYGRKTSRRFAFDLAEKGVTIVSGMALGIDSAAHEGALQAKGKTIAVLGSGLNKIYPSQNEKLAERISENGALVSEYPMDMEPLPKNFPIRNRLISGLSQAVVVIEARTRSGALITADCALDQNRDVYAVPGNIDSSASNGTNTLLKQGAKLVMSAEDIFEDLRPKRMPSEAISEEEEKALSFFAKEPRHVDDWLDSDTLPTNQAISLLSRLEIRGLVKQLPGKIFVKTHA